MKRYTPAIALLIASSAARAQGVGEPDLNQPYQLPEVLNPYSMNTIVEGAGVKVGDGTVVHPTVGVLAGVDSNVFYEDRNAAAAGVMRLLVELQAGTLPYQRTAITNLAATSPDAQAKEQGAFQYDLVTYLSWDQYLSTNDNLDAQGGLGAGLLAKGVVAPNKPLSFSFLQNFDRVLRASNFESQTRTNQDINSLNLYLQYRPRGRSLGGYLYYQNMIHVFEDEDQRFANRMHNALGFHVDYQWLPLTRLYLDVAQGVYTGLGEASQKVTSYPLVAEVGLMSSLTVNTTVNARIGYTQGFYQSGPSYATVVGALQLGYRYSPLGRVTAMYAYDHEDSINANFYRDHTFAVMFEQMVNPFVLFARPELHLRRYEGLVIDPTKARDDVIVAVSAGARYQYRDWLALTVDYQLASVQTDFRYDVSGPGHPGLMDDPSYTQHQLLAGLRAAY